MKKKIFLALLCLVLICVSSSAGFCADYKVVIYFDTFIDSRSFMPADPVVINMTVSNPKAMNAHYHNIAAGKKEKAVTEVTLGKPGEPWADSVVFRLTDQKGKIVGVKVSAGPAKEDIVTLGAENFAQHYFFITSEESARLTEGVYTVEAAVNNIRSNALSLTMISKKKVTGEESIPQLLKFGRYHLVRGEFEKARGYANSILSINESSLNGMHLLGDALTGLARYKEAYDIFSKAVDEYFLQFPPPEKFSANYRPPDIFLDKMRELKKKMKR